MSALVSIRNVVKGYVRGKQRVEVLHALNLDVDAGEFLALMGPSGSGKTTLLNLIGGLDKPDKGEITVAGERIDRSEARLVHLLLDDVLLVLEGERDDAATIGSEVVQRHTRE